MAMVIVWEWGCVSVFKVTLVLFAKTRVVLEYLLQMFQAFAMGMDNAFQLINVHVRTAGLD